MKGTQLLALVAAMGLLATALSAPTVSAHYCVGGQLCDGNVCPDDGAYHFHSAGGRVCTSGPIEAPTSTPGWDFLGLLANALLFLAPVI